MTDDYWSEENRNKRNKEIAHLYSIREQISTLQKQYNELTDQYAETNWDLETNRYLVYTFVESIPYGWETNGPTHIDTIANTCEETERTGWITSSSRCS